MSLDGNRQLEWQAHNAARQYPFAMDATLTDSSAQFTIPESLLTAVYLHLPWDRDVDHRRFFISRIANLTAKLLFRIAYASPLGGSLTVADAELPLASFASPAVAEWVPASGWEDVAGSLVVGDVPQQHDAPKGTFAFNLAAARLDADTIRRTGRQVSGIGLLSQPGQTMSGAVHIHGGENIRLRTDLEGPRLAVIIDAVSSEFLQSGDCGCGAVPKVGIRTLNAAQPSPAGDMSLKGNKCLTIQTAEAELSLDNPCSDPCCECQDAQSLTQTLLPYNQAILDVAVSADTIAERLQRLGFERSRQLLDLECHTTQSDADVVIDDTTTTTAAPSTSTTAAV